MTAKLAPALRTLEPLIGSWDVRIAVPELRAFTGKTIFSPVVERGQLSMATVLDGDGPPDSYCVFGADEQERYFQMLYADERGGSRVYAGVFNGNRWEMWRRTNGISQRFVGIVGEGGNTIDARWETSNDGAEWRLDFEMFFERADEDAMGAEAPEYGSEPA